MIKFILDANYNKMYIIIKNDYTNEIINSEVVLNFIYGDNEDYVKKWIEVYFDDIIEKNENRDYFVEIENSIYSLVKKQQVRVNGYIFNTYRHITKKVSSVRYLKFSETKENDLLKTLSNNIKLNNLGGLYPEITNHINHKVLSNISRQSLYEIYCTFEGVIRTKNTWNTIELIVLQNKITRDLKNDLYNTTVKKSKKISNKSKGNMLNNKKIVKCDEIKNYEVVG